jgi:PAS domain S-box-containing protein
MLNIAHDLFLLSTNLSQLKSKDLIIKLFIESINEIFPNHEFSWRLQIDAPDAGIVVCTRLKEYGRIQISNYNTFINEEFVLLQNAVQLLAIILEKLEQDQLLLDQKNHLNHLVEEKMLHLIRNQEELEENKKEIEAQNEEYLQINDELNQTNLELLKAKEKAEKSEEKFRLMIKNSNDTFVLINEKGEQFYISDAAKTHTGFEIEELKGPIENVIHPDDKEIIGKAWHEVMSTKGAAIRVQYRHKHKFKDFIWYEAVAQNLIDNPVINAVVVNVRDITTIKEYEQEIVKAKEKAEESDRLKTAFLQNMSHEIRTPMNAIMGFSDLLSGTFDDKPKLERFSKIINQRCIDLLEIINDILDISKIESGQLPVNVEKCNLSELFADLSAFFNEFQKRIGKQHIHFTMADSCNFSGSKYIITDVGKLKQIFINLINNAFKFTNEGKIEAGCRFNEKNKLIFYVTDTGIGIPADKNQLIFERFIQLNPDANKVVSGTGLGLSIVKGLVTLLGGKIRLESEPNLGSTFEFEIPYETAETARKNVNELEIANKGLVNKVVLIVEDDDYNADYLKEILAGNGLVILHAENGQQAVDIAVSNPIDLILMDIRLPDFDGYEAIRQIRNLKPELKIIAQTAYASHDDRQKAIDAGCIDYISKPTKKNLLLAVMNKHLV